MQAATEDNFNELVRNIFTRLSKRYNFYFVRGRGSIFGVELIGGDLDTKKISYSTSDPFDLEIELYGDRNGESRPIKKRLVQTGIVDEIDEQKLEDQIRKAIESLIKK